MTGAPTWTEAVAIIVAFLGGLWRWQERKDERSDIAEAKEEAEKTVAALKETVAAKDSELELKERVHAEAIQRIEHRHERELDRMGRELERKEDRIARLEELCYRKGDDL